jgi:mannose-6-phosphate isomerase-like protein (cupin superfamily)
VIRTGFVIENPNTHSRTIVLETEAETGDRGWLLEHHLPAHAASDVPEHIHMTWTETFEIISGRAIYLLNREKKTANAGDVIVMPPRVPHVHPWNAGDSELVYRQRDDFGGVDPGAVQDVLGVFATRAGLTRAGLCDKRGRPKNPLQLAVTLKLLTKHGGYDANAPLAAQNFIAGTLGTLGVLLGYTAVIDEYLGQ